MAEFVKRDQEALIAQFEVPYRGTMQGGAIHQVPPNGVWESMNVFVYEGKLRARAGLRLLNTSTFRSAVLGGGLSVTPQQNILLAITRDRLYELPQPGSLWTQASTLTFTNDANYAVVDTAGLETSGQYVMLIASDGFPLKAWESITHATADVVPTTGTVPRAKSVCICGRRVVTLTAPHTVNWSEVLDYKSWSALSYNKLAQTNDLGIAVRSIGTLGCVVYKERSLYVGRVTGQPFGGAFSFGEPIFAEGPAGTHAVVNIPGGHMYMTKNGRIGIFDGSNYPIWIADGIWRYLQKDIHPSYSFLIRAVYDYRLHTVNFYYPRLSGNATLQGLVVVNLPLEGQDIEGSLGSRPYAFLGHSSVPVTYATELRFSQQLDRSIIFTAVGSNITSSYQDVDATLDGAATFNCAFQTGLVAMPQLKHTNVTVEAMLERGTGYGHATVEPVISYQLAERTGNIPDLKQQNLNLEMDPVNEYLGFDTPTRYFGLKYTWTSDNLFRYAGSMLYGKGV
jgi:hypothetical protein